MSQLPYFLSDFHHFAPICRDIFTLSFEIMVILDWTSPLSAKNNKHVASHLGYSGRSSVRPVIFTNEIVRLI